MSSQVWRTVAITDRCLESKWIILGLAVWSKNRVKRHQERSGDRRRRPSPVPTTSGAPRHTSHSTSHSAPTPPTHHQPLSRASRFGSYLEDPLARVRAPTSRQHHHPPEPKSTEKKKKKFRRRSKSESLPGDKATKLSFLSSSTCHPRPSADRDYAAERVDCVRIPVRLRRPRPPPTTVGMAETPGADAGTDAVAGSSRGTMERLGARSSTSTSTSSAITMASHQSTDLRCCCGRDDCVFLRHNCSVLLTVERDVHTAAKMGQVCLTLHSIALCHCWLLSLPFPLAAPAFPLSPGSFESRPSLHCSSKHFPKPMSPLHIHHRCEACYNTYYGCRTKDAATTPAQVERIMPVKGE